MLRRRSARTEWDNQGVPPLDSAACLDLAFGAGGEDPAKKRARLLAGSVQRRLVSSLLALLLAGPAFLIALPTLTYTQQMIASYYGERASERCEAGDFAGCVAYWRRSIEIAPATASS